MIPYASHGFAIGPEDPQHVFETLETEKQTKHRNETGLDLSLGERLTRLSKRLSRKRCCDTTPDRCLECSRLTILLRIVKKCFVFFQNRGLVGPQGLKRTK